MHYLYARPKCRYCYYGVFSSELIAIGLIALVGCTQVVCHAHKLPQLGTTPRISSALSSDVLRKRNGVPCFRIQQVNANVHLFTIGSLPILGTAPVSYNPGRALVLRDRSLIPHLGRASCKKAERGKDEEHDLASLAQPRLTLPSGTAKIKCDTSPEFPLSLI